MALNDMTADEQRVLFRSAYGRQLLRVISQSTAPVQWTDPVTGAPSNGSMFFTNTGSRFLAITARHVFEAYSELRRQDSRTTCQVMNVPFDLWERSIAVGQRADVATFHITESELRTMGRMTVPWPPTTPNQGDSILVAGFPGVTRKIATTRITYGIYAAIAVAQSISSWDISYAKPPGEESLVDINGNGLPPQNYDLGGMSGGPVALLRDAGLVSWAVSGVIYECHQSFDILKATRADVIRPDGTICDW